MYRHDVSTPSLLPSFLQSFPFRSRVEHATLVLSLFVYESPFCFVFNTVASRSHIYMSLYRSIQRFPSFFPSFFSPPAIPDASLSFQKQTCFMFALSSPPSSPRYQIRHSRGRYTRYLSRYEGRKGSDRNRRRRRSRARRVVTE